MKAWPRFLLQIFVATTLMAASVGLAFADDFPGGKPDRGIIKTQQKVDRLFEKGNYERAFFIYRHELAPLGDKYAQYMVGYMFLAGKGVEVDLAAASAWYRLSAERGESHFVGASNELLQALPPAQREQANFAYFELRKELSDVMLVANLIEKDLLLHVVRWDLRGVSSGGGGVGFDEGPGAGPGTFYEAAPTRSAGMDPEVRDRIEQRLAYMTRFFESGRPYADDELARFQEIKEKAAEALDSE